MLLNQDGFGVRTLRRVIKCLISQC